MAEIKFLYSLYEIQLMSLRIITEQPQRNFLFKQVQSSYSICFTSLLRTCVVKWVQQNKIKNKKKEEVK